MLPIQREIRRQGSPERARLSMRYFKTGPGEYGEGDRFIGLTVPQMREIAKKHMDLDLDDLGKLIASSIHEERLAALVILVKQYSRARDPKIQKKIFDFYLKHRRWINNWDLVDSSAPTIVGGYCRSTGETKTIFALAKSKRHWDRRVAMLATAAFIREGELALTWKLATQFLNDDEDLMHKATGWMLREAGKKNPAELRQFIAKYGKRMPRTMLRYSIEKFSPPERARILKQTKAYQ